MPLSEARQQVYQPNAEQEYLMKGTTTIYQGSIVMLDGGYAAPGEDKATCIFAGVAKETVVNAGNDGDKKIAVYAKGVFSFAATGAAVSTWVGQKMVIVDDESVGLDTTNDVPVGRCVKVVSATEVLVAIDTLG